MATTVGEISVKVGADLSDLQKGLTAAQGKLKKFGTGLTKFGKTLTKRVSAPVAAFGTLAVATFAKTGDEIAKTSKRVGVSVKTLSGLKLSADLAGASFGSLTTGFRRLSSAAFDADQGLAESKRAFEAIGVSVRDAQGNLKDMDTLFFEAVDGLAKMTNETEKAALAQDLFGRSGLQLIPMINEGSQALREQIKEAERLGIVWTEEDAKGAEDLTDAMTRLKFAMQGLAKRFVVDTGLGEKLTSVFNSLAGMIGGLDSKVIKIAGTIAGLAAVLGPVIIIMGMVANGIGAIIGLGSVLIPILIKVASVVGVAMAKAIAGVTVLMTKLAIAAAPLLIKLAAIIGIGVALGLAARVVISNWERLKVSFQNILGKVSNTFKKNFNAIKFVFFNVVSAVFLKMSELSGDLQKLADKVPFGDAIRDQLAVMSAATATHAGKMLGHAEEAAKGVVESSKDIKKKALPPIVTFGDEAKKAVGEFKGFVGGVFGGLKKDVDTGVEAIDTTGLETKVQQTVDKAGEVITTLDDKIKANQETFQTWFFNIGTTMEQFAELSSSVFDQFATGIGDAVADAIVLGESLAASLQTLMQNIARTIISTLVKIGVQRAIQAIAAIAASKKQAAFEGKANVSKTFTGQMAAMSAAPWPINLTAPAVAKSMAATTAAGVGVTAFAEGGLVNRPTIGLIGEAGPELVLPLNRIGDVFGNTTQVIVVEVDGEEITRRVVQGMPEMLGVELGLDIT